MKPQNFANLLHLSHHFLESWGDAEAKSWLCQYDAANYFTTFSRQGNTRIHY